MRKRSFISLLPTMLASCLAPASKAASNVRTISYKNTRYVPLDSICSLFSMQQRTAGKTITLSNRWHTLKFTANSRMAEIDGTAVWLHQPLRRLHNDWALTETDYDKTVDPPLNPRLHLKDCGRYTVVLDPGHGGKDKGASGRRNVQEKLVVLDVAKRVEKHLKNQGLRVRKTRSKDEFIPVWDRPKKAAAYKADVFVSIHLNATTSSSVGGTETYVMTAAGEESTNAYGSSSREDSAYRGNRRDGANMVLGYHIQKELTGKLKLEDRGIRRARFAVLKEAPCPAALVECAFVSNPTEENKMLSADFRENIAAGISAGIGNYIAAVKNTGWGK